MPGRRPVLRIHARYPAPLPKVRERRAIQHSGALLHIMEMHAEPKLKQNRTGWITDDLKVKRRARCVLRGLSPVLSGSIFEGFSFAPVSIAQDTVRILNHLGIEPAIMDNERCCGHDCTGWAISTSSTKWACVTSKKSKRPAPEPSSPPAPNAPIRSSALSGAGRRLALTVKHISGGRGKYRPIQVYRASAGDLYQTLPLGGTWRVRSAAPGPAAIPGVTLHEMPHNRRGAICWARPTG